APHGPMHAKKSDLLRVSANVTDEKRRIFAAMMLNLDDNIGRLLAFLEREELTKNTMIVFMSDNGGPLRHNASDNGKLRGKKGDLWEGGMRVPYAIQWKGVIPEGQVSAEMVSSLDLMPTFAAISGADKQIKFETDGIDLTPLMTNKVSSLKSRAFFWRRNYTDHLAVRSGKYKYFRDRIKKKDYLFNLDVDTEEKNNLAESSPELLSELRKELFSWEETMPEPAFDSGWRRLLELRKSVEDQNKH
ncbi:MAG: sulfatase-like hydrolase/transferase, partial [Lentisphaeraceae bacterium]|nr:sulfatase-like hydrolase/transferase [Lentisphaeraceae bacterium]